MRITTRKEDDIVKVFSNNAYVAYIDDDDTLYGFYQGVPVFLGKDVSINEATRMVERWLRNGLRAQTV